MWSHVGSPSGRQSLGRRAGPRGAAPGGLLVVSLPGPRPPSPPGTYRPGPGPTRANSPSVCSSLQPQAQGSRGRRRPGRRAGPARTLRSPKGRLHGCGTGCSSGRSGGAAAAARRPATAGRRARGAQRSRGSIAAAARTRAAEDDQGPGAPGRAHRRKSRPARDPLPPRLFASPRHRGGAAPSAGGPRQCGN